MSGASIAIVQLGIPARPSCPIMGIRSSLWLANSPWAAHPSLLVVQGPIKGEAFAEAVPGPTVDRQQTVFARSAMPGYFQRQMSQVFEGLADGLGGPFPVGNIAFVV